MDVQLMSGIKVRCLVEAQSVTTSALDCTPYNCELSSISRCSEYLDYFFSLFVAYGEHMVLGAWYLVLASTVSTHNFLLILLPDLQLAGQRWAAGRR